MKNSSGSWSSWCRLRCRSRSWRWRGWLWCRCWSCFNWSRLCRRSISCAAQTGCSWLRQQNILSAEMRHQMDNCRMDRWCPKKKLNTSIWEKGNPFFTAICYNIIIKEYNNLKLKEKKCLFLKKSILQEAIQGKLVPQDQNDEPANEDDENSTDE